MATSANCIRFDNLTWIKCFSVAVSVLFSRPQSARSAHLIHPSHTVAHCGLFGVSINHLTRWTCTFNLHDDQVNYTFCSTLARWHMFSYFHWIIWRESTSFHFMVEYQSPYWIVRPVPKWNYFSSQSFPLLKEPENKLDVCNRQNGLTLGKKEGASAWKIHIYR